MLMTVASGTETVLLSGAQCLGVTHQLQTGWDASRVLSEAWPDFHKEVT